MSAYDPMAPVQVAILIMLCIVFWAWILYKSLTMSSRPRRISSSGLTDFEAKQRGIGKDEEGELHTPTTPRAEPLSVRLKTGVAMVVDLKFLSDSVGGRGSMEGVLCAGLEPKPRKVRVKMSGGIPICPICGMPMERLEALRKEKELDFLVWRESGDRRWRCYHEYPVVFEPFPDETGVC